MQSKNMINILFYFFSTILGFSSLCIVLFQNTFFALLFLILSFLLVSILFLLLECEFLALILIIIYVGAVAILLLFVLMMLETKLKSFSKNILIYFPFGMFINGIFFIEFIILLNKSFDNNEYLNSFSVNSYSNWYVKIDSLMDLEIYGHFLYSQFLLQFLVVGLVLFLALIGVIFLVLKPMPKTFRNPTSFSQLSRNYVEQNVNQILL